MFNIGLSSALTKFAPTSSLSAEVASFTRALGQVNRSPRRNPSGGQPSARESRSGVCRLYEITPECGQFTQTETKAIGENLEQHTWSHRYAMYSEIHQVGATSLLPTATQPFACTCILHIVCATNALSLGTKPLNQDLNGSNPPA